MLCYVGIILIALFHRPGPVGPFFIVMLFFIALTLLGVGLGWTARGLREWHLLSLPQDSEQQAPTPAQNAIKRIASGLITAGLMTAAAGAGFYLTGVEVAFLVLIPLTFGIAATWYTVTGIVTRPGLSRNQTLQREAIWRQMPRVRAQRVRRANKIQITKIAFIVIVPIGILHNVIVSYWPGSGLEVLTSAAAGIAFIGIMGVFIFFPELLNPSEDDR